MKIDWSKQVTQEQIDAYQESLKKERECLRCSQKFMSEFKGNRICAYCKDQDDNALFCSNKSSTGNPNEVDEIL